MLDISDRNGACEEVCKGAFEGICKGAGGRSVETWEGPSIDRFSSLKALILVK